MAWKMLQKKVRFAQPTFWAVFLVKLQESAQTGARCNAQGRGHCRITSFSSDSSGSE